MSRCVRGRSHGEATIGNLCRKCADRLHPGEVFFMGRWRTREAAIDRIRGDRAMRGVAWALEGGFVVGRLGSFEIRLHAPPAWVLEAGC